MEPMNRVSHKNLTICKALSLLVQNYTEKQSISQNVQFFIEIMNGFCMPPDLNILC